jgi:hypothetical protein
MTFPEQFSEQKSVKPFLSYRCLCVFLGWIFVKFGRSVIFSKVTVIVRAKSWRKELYKFLSLFQIFFQI